jgi:hypothetical protein
MTIRRERYIGVTLRPGTRAFVHLTQDEFEMLGLSDDGPDTFREPSDNGMRLLAGTILVGDPYRPHFDIHIQRRVLSLRWRRLVSPRT